MRHFVSRPFALLALTALGSATVLVAPEQTRAAGLDLWNVADNEAELRVQSDQRQDLEFEHQQLRERNVIGNEIARNFCDGHTGFHEALGAVAELAEASPDWFARLKTHYRTCHGLPAMGADSAVMARYLRVRIDQVRQTAELSGDKPRGAAMSARLALFDREVARLFPSDPAP